MNVKFDLFTPSTGHASKDVPTEYVRISRPPPPPPVTDETHRPATDADKLLYAKEYAAFKASLEAPAPTPPDASLEG